MLYCTKCFKEVEGAFLCPECGTYLRPPETRFVYEMMKKKDVEGLIKNLKHEDFGIQLAAAAALGELRDDRAVEPLIQAFFTPAFLEGARGNPAFRREIVKALGKIGDARAVEPLIKLCEEGDFRHVLKAAVEALGKIGDRRATSVLSRLELRRRSAWEKDEKEIRESAITALGKTGGPEAVNSLIIILLDKSEDEGIRYLAAMALGETGDEKAYDALIRAESDPSRLVRSGAELACRKLLRDLEKKS